MSKEIPLSQGKVAIVDDEDYEHVNRFNWIAAKRGKLWYAQHCCRLGRFADGHCLASGMYLHRYLMRPPKGLTIDHKDCNGLNCRRTNMRIASQSLNNANQKTRKRTKGCFKGVTWCKERNKWAAQISYRNRRIPLGRFHNEIEAAKVYDQSARKLFGEFARTNF